MPIDLCTLTGEVGNITGTGLAPAGTRVYVRRVQLDGYAHSTAYAYFLVNADGELETPEGDPASLPQGAYATLQGSVEGFESAVTVVIPEVSEYPFASLIPAPSAPSTAATQSALAAEVARATAAETALDARVDALEVGGGAWGDITGTLSDQTDLQAALDAKADASDLSELSGEVGQLSTDLTAEATARTNADAALTTALEAQGDALDALDLEVDTKAPLASPALTGVPTAPTAAPGTNTTQIATTAFSAAAVAAEATARDSAISTASTADRARANHTGTQSADTLTDGTTNKAFTATEQTKLAGIATGATANSTDATLLARANHTGTQLAATISDFTSAVAALIAVAVGVTVQAYSAVLTAFAALSPSNDDFLQRKAGAWANRTVAQVKTDLGLTGTNSGDQTSIVGITGTLAQFDTAVTDADLARRDAAQTLTGNQTIAGDLLASSDGGRTIGAAAASRFGIYAYGLNVSNTGPIAAGVVKVGATTSGISLASGFLQLGSGVGLGWSSGDVFSAAEDVRIKRAKAQVLEVNNASTGGGTMRFVPARPTQITSNQNDYAVSPPSKYIHLSTDAARNVTGLSISQVDGEEHVIVNTGSNNLVLVNESASSTAANRFTNSTGADITLAANQAAVLHYDGTTSRWRVYKRN